MKILPKKLLSIADVATYLNNLNFDYDLNQPMIYKKLMVDIFELNVQQNIPILFRYSGEIESHIDIYTYIEDAQIEGVISTNVDNLVVTHHASGIFYLTYKDLKKILIEQEDLLIKGFFTPIEQNQIISTLEGDLFISKYKENYTVHQSYYINSSEYLTADDILIPIESLNTFFNTQINSGTSLEDCLKSQVAELELEVEELNEKLTEAKREIDELEKRLRNNDELFISNGSKAFDWDSMNKYTYPPELHLAIEIWKEYYDDGQLIMNSNFNTGKFNTITKRIGPLNNNLSKRLRTILTSFDSKRSVPSLYNNLKSIEILNTDEE